MLQGANMFPPGMNMTPNPNLGNSQNQQLSQMASSMQSMNPMGQSGSQSMA